MKSPNSPYNNTATLVFPSSIKFPLQEEIPKREKKKKSKYIPEEIRMQSPSLKTLTEISSPNYPNNGKTKKIEEEFKKIVDPSFTIDYPFSSTITGFSKKKKPSRSLMNSTDSAFFQSVIKPSPSGLQEKERFPTSSVSSLQELETNFTPKQRDVATRLLEDKKQRQGKTFLRESFDKKMTPPLPYIQKYPECHEGSSDNSELLSKIWETRKRSTEANHLLYSESLLTRKRVESMDYPNNVSHLLDLSKSKSPIFLNKLAENKAEQASNSEVTEKAGNINTPAVPQTLNEGSLSVFSDLEFFNKKATISQKREMIENLMRKNLQRENNQFFPSKLLTRPNDRKLIIDLGSWIDEMIKGLKDRKGVGGESIRLQEVFDNLQIIYQVALKEIVRQVTIECQERGILLQRLIDGFIDIFEKAICEHNKEKIQHEKDSFEKERALHKSYIEKLSQLTKNIETLQRQLEISKRMSDSHERELNYLKKKEKKLLNELNSLQSDIKSIQSEFTAILKDNAELRVFYEETIYVQKYELENRGPMDDEALKRFRDGVIGRVEDTQGGKKRKLLMLGEKGRAAEDLIYTIDLHIQEEINNSGPEVKLDMNNGDDNILKDVGVNTVVYKFSMATDTMDLPKDVKDKSVHAWVFMKNEYVETEKNQKSKEIQTMSEQEVNEILNKMHKEDKKQEEIKKKREILKELLPKEDIRKKSDNETQFDESNIILESPSRNSESDGENKEIAIWLSDEENESEIKKLSDEELSPEKEAEISNSFFGVGSQLDMEMEDEPVSPRKGGKKRSLINNDKKKQKIDIKKELEKIDLKSIKRGNKKKKTLINEKKAVDEMLRNKKITKDEAEVLNLNIIVQNQNRFIEQVLQLLIETGFLEETKFLDIESVNQILQMNKQFESHSTKRIQRILKQTHKNFKKNLELKISNHEKDIELQDAEDRIEKKSKLYDKMLGQVRAMNIEMKRASIVSNDSKNNDSVSINSPEVDRYSISINQFPEIKLSDVNNGSLLEVGGDTPMADAISSPMIKVSPVLNESFSEASEITPSSAVLVGSSKNSIDGNNNYRINRSPSKTILSVNIPRSSSNNLTQVITSPMKRKTFTKNVDNALNRLSMAKADGSLLNLVPANDVPKRSGKESRFATYNYNPKESIPTGLSLKVDAEMLEKKRFRRTTSVNVDAANAILNKAKSGLLNPNLKSLNPKSNILKFITSLYLEKIKQFKGNERENPLHVVTYDFFLKKYGFKKMAETKLIQFLESCLFFKDHSKIDMFSRFYGLYSPMDYEVFDFYISCIITLDETGQMLLSANQLAPFSKGEELVNKIFKNRLLHEKLEALLKEIEKFKTADALVKNKIMIDVEPFLLLIVKVFQESQNFVVEALRDLYLAGDVDNDLAIGYEEFTILFRHMEKDRFSTVESLRIFYNYVDLVDDNSDKKSMTFVKFANMAVELQLFSHEAQKSLLKDAGCSVKNPFTGKNLSRLLKLWYKNKNEIRMRLMRTKNYGSFFLKMVKKIDKYIEGVEKADDFTLNLFKTSRSIWFLYKLVDEESKRMLIDDYIELNLFPPAFSQIPKTTELVFLERLKDGFSI